MLALVACAASEPDASTASTAPAPAQAPVAGCPVFPADNWWHADISDAARPPAERGWLRHMSPSSNLHPDFGPSFGDGPNYGIPITVVDGDHRKVRVRFDYADESDRAALPAGPRHPDRGRTAQ